MSQHPILFIKPLHWGGGRCVCASYADYSFRRIAQGDPCVNACYAPATLARLDMVDAERLACVSLMNDRTAPASPDLLAANRRLHELRSQAQAKRQATHTAAITSGPTRPQLETAGVPGWHLPVPQSQSPEQTDFSSPSTPVISRIIADLPPHLGWGSAMATTALRNQQRENDQSSRVDGQWSTASDYAAHRAPQSPQSPHTPQVTVRLYPDIGLGMLRQEKTAPGRLWLLLHHLDPTGRGVLCAGSIKQQLTRKSSDRYLCGKRQLRNLLRAGEGVFWTRDKTHIWLRSAGRVAYALGVEQLTGRPVALPVSALLSGIGEFRAHLYTAFHSGRVKGAESAAKGPQTARTGQFKLVGMPIARDTLADLSGVGQSSQRAYEERLRLRPQVNYAIGEATTADNEEERAWQQGRALFTLKDYRGRQGKQGKSYLAWRLPNSYSGQHQQRPKGRQKRINRQLRDLVMKGMPGNGEEAVETQRPEKRYYPNGRSASQSRGSHAAAVRYWQRDAGNGNGRSAIWHPLHGG
jgi:hypothetical protein